MVEREGVDGEDFGGNEEKEKEEEEEEGDVEEGTEYDWEERRRIACVIVGWNRPPKGECWSRWVGRTWPV